MTTGRIGHALRFASLLAALALGACTFTLGPVVPHPTISLAQSKQTLALALANSIPDTFQIPGGPSGLRVSGFRTSIANGYAASVARYYQPGGADADLVLHFESAMLEYSAGGGAMVLRFAARLDDHSGRTVGRSFGSLRLERGIDMEGMMDEAMTKMWEKVAADCFVPLSIAH